jgi:hypothetical protein
MQAGEIKSFTGWLTLYAGRRDLELYRLASVLCRAGEIHICMNWQIFYAGLQRSVEVQIS